MGQGDRHWAFVPGDDRGQKASNKTLRTSPPGVVAGWRTVFDHDPRQLARRDQTIKKTVQLRFDVLASELSPNEQKHPPTVRSAGVPEKEEGSV
jgi:hypothetical protein